MRRHALRITALRTIALGAVMMLAACATAVVRPGTGQLTFRLTWTGPSDLDLYVLSPSRERVDFLHTSVDSGGTLDVDCNVANFLCPEPIENIFWPRGSAPSGNYKYWAVIAKERGLQPTDTYTLRVLFLGEVVKEHRGAIVDLREDLLTGWIRVP